MLQFRVWVLTDRGVLLGIAGWLRRLDRATTLCQLGRLVVGGAFFAGKVERSLGGRTLVTRALWLLELVLETIGSLHLN